MDKTPASARTPQRRLGVGLHRRSLVGLLRSAQTSTAVHAAIHSTRDVVNSSPPIATPTIHNNKRNPSSGLVLATPITAASRQQPTTAAENSLPIGSQSTGGRLAGNGRLYRLSLNSRVREKYSRKRLNFTQPAKVQQEIAPKTGAEELESRTNHDNDDGDDDDCDDLAVLRARCQAQKELLEAAEERVQDQEQLRAAIGQWEHGFRGAFANLLDLVGVPDIENGHLFAQLNIPSDLLGLLE